MLIQPFSNYFSTKLLLALKKPRLSGKCPWRWKPNFAIESLIVGRVNMNYEGGSFGSRNVEVEPYNGPF